MAKKLTQVLGSIKCELIFGDPRYIRHIAPWSFYSTVVDDWCDAPTGFVNDTESVPFVRGSNRESGAGHDLTCRTNFVTREKKISPTKLQSARIYLELQKYFDAMERKRWDNSTWKVWAKDQPNRFLDFVTRYGKAGFVAVCPDFVYWHKYTVEATYEEMSNAR
jgi:hypothetical protein